MGILRTILKKAGIYDSVIGYKHRFDARKHEHQEVLNKENRIQFYRSFIAPGSLVFDVGANMGNRVEIFLQLRTRVVAVEPQAECQDHLVKVFGDKIQLIRQGLGEKVEQLTMYLSDVNTISSLSEEWIASVKESRFSGHQWNKTATIEITTLDNVIATYGLPDFCKIDVEGYEVQVLKGLSQPIPYLSLEYTVPEQSHRLRECVDLCNKLSAAYQYNYSIGEDMHFASPDFLSYSEFIRLIETQSFVDTGFGDIYVKLA